MKERFSWRRIIAILLAIITIILFPSCNNSKDHGSRVSNETTTSTTSTVADNEKVAIDLNKEYKRADSGQRYLTGTFVQMWYCSRWTEKRWRNEMQNMVDNGLKYLIVPAAASKNKNSDQITTYFPTNLQGATCSSPVLDTLFKVCDEYGIKVFMAPYADDQWYSNEFGWKEHDSVDDKYGQWMKQYTDTSNKLAKEIYDLYKKKYPETFYGWYFADELWNMTIICQGTGKKREVALDILALGFNNVLDFYTELDPSMPFIFSPFSNRSLSSAQQYMNMWIDLFARVRFREGDIFCPQDSIGGKPNEIEVLDLWTRAYRQAVDTKPGLKFWMNNENFTGDYHATIDRLKKQIDITANYCEANITFSWQHHYSPYHENVPEGYSKTYHDFYVNGVLDNIPPTPPEVTVEKSDEGWTIRYKNATDNIGVAGFYIYRNKEDNLLSTARVSKNIIPNRYITQIPGVYFIQAFDFAGNRSQMAKVEIVMD